MRIKTILLILGILHFNLYGQFTPDVHDVRSKFDSIFSPLLTRSIPHDVLYDRVVP